jgi:Phage integrase family
MRRGEILAMKWSDIDWTSAALLIPTTKTGVSRVIPLVPEALQVLDGLPPRFCWSRFGTEAGEKIDAILTRKDRERVANSGIFLWGIGTALAPSINHLIEVEANPRVVFSPMRSAPKAADVEPCCVVRWTAGVTLDGRRYDLPSGSTVTSRAPISSRRNHHYALVCASTAKLEIKNDAEMIVFGELRNLLTGRPIGASQVTAIVQRSKEQPTYSNLQYPAAIEAELTYPFFIKLTDPVFIRTDQLQ